MLKRVLPRRAVGAWGCVWVPLWLCGVAPAGAQSPSEAPDATVAEAPPGSAEAAQPALAQAPEQEPPHTAGGDFVEVLRLSGLGFVHQFTHWQAGVLWGVGAVVTGVTFIGDEDAWQLRIEERNLFGDGFEKAGDWGGLALSIGIVPVATYTVARIVDDERAIHFAMEVAAVQIITSIETLLISQIPVHERPVEGRGDVEREEQDFFNVIRGRSSFPSGHAAGPAAIAFKSWEFYGWKLGVPATLAALLVGYARVQEGQHFVSDVVGSYALAAVASWAVSSARNPFTYRGVRWMPYASSQGAGVRIVGAM